jgi:hypothetical protein
MYGMQNGPMKKTEEDCRMAQMKHKETRGRGKHGSLISEHFLMLICLPVLGLECCQHCE